MRAKAATIAAINDYRQGAGSGRLDGVRTRGAGHILLALAPAAREIDFFFRKYCPPERRCRRNRHIIILLQSRSIEPIAAFYRSNEKVRATFSAFG
jgi:hypothetical protein